MRLGIGFVGVSARRRSAKARISLCGKRRPQYSRWDARPGDRSLSRKSRRGPAAAVKGTIHEQKGGRNHASLRGGRLGRSSCPDKRDRDVVQLRYNSLQAAFEKRFGDNFLNFAYTLVKGDDGRRQRRRCADESIQSRCRTEPGCVRPDSCVCGPIGAAFCHGCAGTCSGKPGRMGDLGHLGV